MKRILTILILAAAVCGLWSCAKPDADYVHDSATISAIKMGTTQKDASGKEKAITFDGVIDQDAGTIAFTVPKDKRRDIDLTAVKFRANVAFDAYVTVTKEQGKTVDRTLYGILQQMSTRGEVVDMLTVLERLRAEALLDAVGGAAFLEGLVDATPTAAHAEYYIDIVRQKALLRRAIRCLAGHG